MTSSPVQQHVISAHQSNYPDSMFITGVDEQLRLQPSVDMVNQSSYAVFNCSYHCTSQSPQTHTIHWLVGDAESLSERSFVNGDEQSFTDRSGLSVDVDDISICTGRAQRAIQQLRINGSSAEQHNRTAVQCVAVPTSINVKTFYSSYSLMLINNPVNGKLFMRRLTRIRKYNWLHNTP